MKKTILIIAAVAFIALIGTQASACYYDRHWGGPTGEPIAGTYGGQFQGFYDNTNQLRQDLAARQGEYNALLVTSNPDPKRSEELNREITILYDQLKAQARSYNLPTQNTGYQSRMGGYGCWW